MFINETPNIIVMFLMFHVSDPTGSGSGTLLLPQPSNAFKLFPPVIGSAAVLYGTGTGPSAHLPYHCFLRTKICRIFPKKNYMKKIYTFVIFILKSATTSIWHKIYSLSFFSPTTFTAFSQRFRPLRLPLHFPSF